MPIPRHTWILDSLPGDYEPDPIFERSSDQSVTNIMRLLTDMPATFPSKELAIQHLSNAGLSPDIVQWIAMNIKSTGTNQLCKREVKFSYDMDVINELFRDFCRVSMWDFLKQYSGEGKIHFIRAGRNPLWDKRVLETFDELTGDNSNIMLHTMSHVGHWLHAEDLDGTLNMIREHSGLT